MADEEPAKTLTPVLSRRRRQARWPEAGRGIAEDAASPAIGRVVYESLLTYAWLSHAALAVPIGSEFAAATPSVVTLHQPVIDVAIDVRVQ